MEITKETTKANLQILKDFLHQKLYGVNYHELTTITTMNKMPYFDYTIEYNGVEFIFEYVGFLNDYPLNIFNYNTKEHVQVGRFDTIDDLIHFLNNI